MQMAEKEVLLTREGLEKLEAELDNLKNVKRLEVAQRIKIAIGFGDLSENSEYEDAKNEQAMVEGQIVELETKIRNARVIEAASGGGRVTIGSTVKLLELSRNLEMEYTIVGSTESDPAKRRISNESPVGEAIIGHQKDEVVIVNAPRGPLEYKILEID
jgi:transcription elongation factor GreA